MAEVCRLLARDHIKIRSPSQDQEASHHKCGEKSEKEKNSLCQRFFKPVSEHTGHEESEDTPRDITSGTANSIRFTASKFGVYFNSPNMWEVQQNTILGGSWEKKP